MAHKNLTDRTLKALKPAPKGRCLDIIEGHGFGVRVSDKGTKTFVLAARYPRNPKHPTRVALGTYLVNMSLAEAREKAEQWRKLMRQGIDPRDEEDRQRQEADRKRENSFAAVAEEFIDHCRRQKLRSTPAMERRLRRTLIPLWGPKPIAEITADDVRRFLRDVPKYEGFHRFSLIRRLFNWAIGRGDYGISTSPCDRLKPSDLIGKREARERTLNNDEIRALWLATERLTYPYAPLYRLLLLTGLRLVEARRAQWSEFDLERREWTVPGARMKGKKPHVVPLTPDILAILDSLPRFTSGEYLFSVNHGRKPVARVDYAKARIDRLMQSELGKPVPPWVNHDTRRTVRTNLSALRIAEPVREAVLAHVRPGINGTCDKHEYADEKREALELWAASLRSIVEPPPANVIEPRKA